ncbi:lysosomal acid lipase cholesteryl ester hydrolase [Colletotrichum truncatum]|uniref:Lysosomal acid lipase cholesteryl ester hydrolase n=1 Tax=Colletotrichum truncatum TaxID=5467 RepID=A0ACC3Z0L7_COLTU|nr:lysosomal acid lipase cholesteryl ester hydrolase [Colletotrichum truncatum]KAF6800625.1 lysosomal acid lipase cholesteryl ester hydrolase [Colletotrichum truncatum]
MPIPFIGRLNIFNTMLMELYSVEYVALVGSFLLVGLEAIIRVLTLALPSPLISLFYRASRRLFNRLSTPAHKRAEEPISTSVRDASDFVDLCRLFGYEAEEHVTQTKDGFLLGLHRLAWKKGEEGQKVNCGPNSLKKKVVYLHHGLLMNSEVWVCLTDEQRCLPFVLVEKGYDVWLGNNRGNKYSKKSVAHSPKSLEFWNFSIDEFAFHDIPDSIAYILETTDQESLSYIGFSQGTAQAFATLAIHPKLNQQVNVFIALAPAMSPAGLSNGIVDALVKASPQVLFLLFGRRSILSSATMWQSILYPPIFVRAIDVGLSFLFNWQTKNISLSQKLAAYPHLYSFTSTKSVVHWFQIIRNKSFQMYDDDVHPPVSISSSSKYTKVAKYPTRNIKTPIVLVYGGSDSLVDIKVMLKELPSQTVATEIPHYEHLDFLWGRDVDAQVFPHVFDALDSFTDAQHSKEEYARYQLARQESLLGSGNAYRHAAKDSDVSASEASNAVDEPQHRNGTESPLSYKSRERRSGIPSPQVTTRMRTPYSQVVANDDDVLSSPDRPDSHTTNPDGKSDGPLDTRESPTAKLKGIGVRRGSGGSHLSLDSMREGKGISLGTSKALGGVVTKSGIDARGLGNAGVDEAKSGKKKKRVTVAP